MSADIICLSKGPPFLRISYTRSYNDPVFHYSHTQRSPFFQNFNLNFQVFARFVRISKMKMANFHSNLTEFTPNDPQFVEVYKKKRKKDPFFYEILHGMPLFLSSGRHRHILATFIYEKCGEGPLVMSLLLSNRRAL